jgi:hypothetical protein
MLQNAALQFSAVQCAPFHCAVLRYEVLRVSAVWRSFAAPHPLRRTGCALARSDALLNALLHNAVPQFATVLRNVFVLLRVAAFFLLWCDAMRCDALQ